MSNWNDYKREEPTRIEPGDYRVVIVSAEEAESKSSGNPMIVLEVQPSGSNMKIKYYLVKNKYFNRNATNMFDSFDIPEGSFNLLEWVGAMGAAKLEEDENGYLKVKWFISKEKSGHLPPFEGTKPEKQEVSDFIEIEEDDDLPF